MELLGLGIAIGGIILAFLFCPEWFRKWIKRAWSELTRRHPAVLVEPEIAIFGGHVELLTDKLLSHPADAARKRQFYEIGPLHWDIIAAHADVERDQQGEVIEHLRQPVDSLRFVCILGESGSGKSTLAWRVAAELHKQQKLVIRVKDKEDPDVWYQVAEFCGRVRRPLYVLADDLFRNAEVRRALAELSPWLPLTVLATSRTNEYRPERLKAKPIPIALGPPSAEEKERVLSRLGKDPGELNPDQLTRLKAANEFLVLMVELTSGRGFEELVRDTLEVLLELEEPIYRAYEYVCFSHSYGFVMPTSLLERLDAEGRFHGLPNRETARGLVFYDENRNDFVRTGHPRRAEAARTLYERRRSSASVLRELVMAVDASEWLERRYIAHLLRSLAHTSIKLVQEALPAIEPKVAECVEHAGRISELSLWRSLYLALERSDEAERCVDAALVMEPVSSWDCNQLVGLYRERGYEGKAGPILDRWIRDHPESGGCRPVYLVLVERHGAEDDQKRAMQETRGWLAKHRDDSYVRTAYLGLVERKGTAQQIERVMRETSAWLGGHPDSRLVRTAYLGLVERKGTAQQIERVLRETSAWLGAHPDDNTVRTAYLGFVERKGTAQQVERVVRETSAWLGGHPDDNNVRTAHLGFVERKGTAEQIERVLRETSAWLAGHPEDSYVRTRFISYLCATGRLDEARALAQEAVEVHSEDEALVGRYLKLADDSLDEARVRELYASVIRSNPRAMVIRNQWARWLHRHNYWDEAELEFKALMTEDPKSFSHLYSYGRLLLDMERYGEAAERFRQVVNMRRRHAMGADGLALALQGLARQAEEAGNRSEAQRLFAAAEGEFKGAIYWGGAGDPQAIFHTHLGELYLERSRLHDALLAFGHAKSEDPDYYGNYWGEARAYEGLGQWRDAARAGRIALQKAPDTLGLPALHDIRQLIDRCEAALATDSRESQIDAAQ